MVEKIYISNVEPEKQQCANCGAMANVPDMIFTGGKGYCPTCVDMNQKRKQKPNDQEG
jgi:uncharacterized paraquat-inducible protein A